MKVTIAIWIFEGKHDECCWIREELTDIEHDFGQYVVFENSPFDFHSKKIERKKIDGPLGGIIDELTLSKNNFYALKPSDY